MKLCLLLASSGALVWHQRLKALLERNHSVDVILLGGDEVARSWSLRAWTRLEKTLRGAPGDWAGAPATWPRVRLLAGPQNIASAIAPYDITINCTDVDGIDGHENRVLTPLFAGKPGTPAVIAALAVGGGGKLAVSDSWHPGSMVEGTPGLADPRLLTLVFDNSASLMMALVAKAVSRSASRPVAPTAEARPPMPRGSLAGHSVRALTYKASRLAGLALAGGECWMVAIRELRGRSLVDGGEAEFRLVENPEGGYFADPFLFSRDGRTYLFLEEFRYGTKRGRISVAEVLPSGKIGFPEPILEPAHHLSFPQVFARDGEIWMIPESGDHGTIDLYRAERFPNRWVHEHTLVSGIAAFDATIAPWMPDLGLTVSIGLDGSTGWDTLYALEAPRLQGPWRFSHPTALLHDARWSRAAGAAIETPQGWLRPAQDCSVRYGGAVRLCRVDDPSPASFRQTPVARIGCAGFGVHTYNRGGGYEVIDVFGTPGRHQTVTASCTPLP